MSLLEDIFLGDEADEAQQLERVIEGDEYDDRPRSRSPSNSDENSEKEDEAEEDKRRVDPTKQKAKKVIKNPRFILNPARLTGPRGIQVIPEHFKDFKFKGKGHEKEDLDLVLKKLEHWAYRLYPKFQFEDCLKKIEILGKKQPVKVHLHRIRTDQLLSQETVVQKDSSDDEQPAPAEEDEFDKLLQQQIELARATPAPGSVKKGFMTPAEKTFAAPKATSSPSINDEQKERMLRNRQLAEERRLARLKENNIANMTIDLSDSQQNSAVSETVVDITVSPLKEKITVIDEPATVDLASVSYTEIPTKNTTNEVEMTTVEDTIVIDTEVVKPRKVNRSNIIDSSDEECDVTAVNLSVSVDIHNYNYKVSKSFGQDREEDVEKTNQNEDSDAIEYNKNISLEVVSNTVHIDNGNVKEASYINTDKMASLNNTVTNIDNNIRNLKSDSATMKADEINNSNMYSITHADDNSYESIEKDESNKCVLVENKEKDVVEESIITEENEKVKNMNIASDKENINVNVVQAEGINEELMDVDFSEDF